MNKLLSLILISIVLGQLVRFSIGGGGAVILSDLLMPLILLIWLLSGLAKKKFIIPKTQLNLPIGLFLTVLIFSFSINLELFFAGGQLQSLAYLIRLISYLLIFFFTVDVVKDKVVFEKFYSYIIWAGLIFAFLGFLQLFFFPSFEFMAKYGWDPHVKRLLSTFFDPNYAGGFLVFANSLVLARMLFAEDKAQKGLLFFAFLFLLLAIVLTYSRSAYLACATMILTIGILKSWRLLLFGAVISVIAFFAFPRMQERIMGGFSLDATAKMRIESYNQAQQIIDDYPILGVGYNNLRSIREDYGQILDPTEHQAGGFDSSFLTILATTGIVGFVGYLWICLAVLKDSIKGFLDKNLPTDFRSLSLGLFAGFLGLLAHSQFVNSLLFPNIMSYFLIILGVFYAGKKIY